jgi:GT2 family glycosyltransferase
MSNFRELVSIVVVTAGQQQWLQQCLKSCQNQSYPNVELILVSNSSAIICGDNLTSGFPRFKTINNTDNRFYAPAQNQGIRTAEGDFILCLNDDVVLENNFIEEALKGFAIDKRIGMVSGKVLSYQDKKVIDSTGLFLGQSRKPVDRGYMCVDNGRFDKKGYIFGVPGAVGMYRKSMLVDIALDGDFFDSEYNIFYEDLDLCWRAQIKKWLAYYIPSAVAYHVRGGTVRQDNSSNRNRYAFTHLDTNLQLFLLRNRYSTIIKNDTVRQYLANIIYILGYELKLWGYIFLRKPLLLYLLLRDLSWIKSSLKKRRVILGYGDNNK